MLVIELCENKSNEIIDYCEFKLLNKLFIVKIF